MDSSGSADNVQYRNNNSRNLLRWHRRRYRDRIWCLSPETWLALGFLLLVMGLSLLNTGYFTSDAEREQVIKCGAFVVCSGWATLIFLVERVRSRNGCRRLYIHNPHSAFVGVSIGPPIQPEFLSAMLLPEIEREWVPVETLPGFEPHLAEIVRLPTQQATTGEESRCKRRRNRKKKVNNSFSELHSASQESNDASIFNIPNQTSEQETLQESSQPTESNLDDENLNKLISQEKDQARHQSKADNHQLSLGLNDTNNKDNSSVPEKAVEESPASDHLHKDSLQTDGLMSEESYIEPVNTSMNLITGVDQQEKLELALSSPNQNYVDDSSEQLNKTPDGHWRNMTILEREKPADQTLSTNTTSREAQQVISKPLSPEFITFTSKRRNRRRKK